MFFESLLLNLFIILVLIFALIFDYVTKYFSYWYVRHIPYKTCIPFFGSDYHRVLGLRSTSTEVNQLYNKYPEDKFIGCIKSRIPDLIVKDPDAVRKILSADFSNFHCRGLGLDKSRDVCLRNNLFYAEGEKWTLLRTKLELLLNNFDVEFQESLHDCLSGINGDTNIQQLLSQLLDIVFKDLLIGNNAEWTCLRKESEKFAIQDRLKSYMKNIFPSIFVVLNLSDVLSKLYDKYCVKDIKLYNDIKKANMVSQHEVTSKHTNKHDTDQSYAYSILAEFITEGFKPCHKVLTSLLYEFARNADIQEEVRKDSNKLDLAIKETLRLHPPFAVISRKCTKMYNFAKNDFIVDKGVTITIPVEAMHRDENNFHEANLFKPERFENESSDAYIPFGLGPRKCVGEDLAMKIIQTLSRVLVKNFIIDTCQSTPKELFVVDRDFQRVINNDVWLKLKPIKAP